MLDFSENILITPEEVKLITGMDLGLRLIDDDNPSNKCERFIYEQQTLLYAFIAKNYKKDLYKYYDRFSDGDKNHIKIAIAIQCKYVLVNGNLGMDASLSIESKSQTKAYAGRICVDAIDELAQCRNFITSKLNAKSWLKDYMYIELNGR